jgi:hypothetical protein
MSAPGEGVSASAQGRSELLDGVQGTVINPRMRG